MLLSKPKWKSLAGINTISSLGGVGVGVSIGVGVFVGMDEAVDVGLGVGLSVNTSVKVGVVGSLGFSTSVGTIGVSASAVGGAEVHATRYRMANS